MSRDPAPAGPSAVRATAAMPVDWQNRAVPAAQAVRAVRPGHRVFVGSACATPRRLLEALEALAPEGVQLIHFLTDGAVARRGGRPSSHFRHRAFYIGRDMRELAEEARVDYVPIALAEVPHLIQSGRLAFDVALVQASPPDERGMCSLGVSVDIVRAAVSAARTVVAEINPRMPRTGPESLVPLARFDHLVAVDEPIIEYLHVEIGDAAERIARYVARIIDDGATLQIGLGRVPNEMLRFLGDRRDLGIHSDVITEPLVDLVARGVVTGARKSIHRGQVVASLAMGTRRLYDLIDGDPRFAFFPIEYVSDGSVIAANQAMVSVTQAFAIDLTGQVCADARDGALYGGVATQPDFHRGASRSPGGKAIICLTSTTDDGESAIRPAFAPSRGGGDSPSGSPLRRHGVRHRLPLRALARRARGGADRDRAPAAPRGPAGRGHRERAAAARPDPPEPGRLSGGGGVRGRAARWPPGDHPPDAGRRRGWPPGAVLPPPPGGRAHPVLPATEIADGRDGAAPVQRQLPGGDGVRRRRLEGPSPSGSSARAATSSIPKPGSPTWRTWWTRNGRVPASARSCRRGRSTTRGVTACADSRRTCSPTTPPCSPCSGARGAA